MNAIVTRIGRLIKLVAITGFIAAAGSISALPVGWGTAGPQNWSILELGTGQLIGLNAGGVSNGITGNVGINQNGNLQLTGSAFVNGNVVLGTAALETTSGSSYVTGTVTTNQAVLTQAATDAGLVYVQALRTPTAGGGLGITSITATSDMILQPGVYNLSSFSVSNGAHITLAAGGAYIFNISGGLSLSGPGGVFLSSGLSSSDVLFNITGTTGVQFSGGGNNPMLYGVILAPNAAINIAPGNVVGEVIGGKEIQIASASNLVATVPDSGSSLVLTILSVVGIFLFGKHRLFVQ